MNKKEVLELKKRFKKDQATFTRLVGCYVDCNREKICKFGGKFLTLEEEEYYKYLEIANKVLSGTLGNNLLNLSFPIEEEQVGGRQQILMALRDTDLEDETLLDTYYDLVIDTTDFNYSRFVSHMHYLLKRGRENTMIQSDNDAIFAATKESFPKAYQAAQSVCRYLLSVSGIDLSEEEQLYLMMHINRLCTREECYQ